MRAVVGRTPDEGPPPDADGEFVPPPWSDLVAAKWSGWALEAGDLFVYGRVVFEYQKAFWLGVEGNDAFPQDMKDFAKTYNERARVVVTKTLTGDPGWNATITDLEGLRALKAQPGGDIICFGGADLAHSLADADLIDEYRIMQAPYTLGGGKKLFDGGPRRDFTLTEVIHTDVDSLILTYARKR